MPTEWCRLVHPDKGIVSGHACGLSGGQSGSLCAMFVTEGGIGRDDAEEEEEGGCWAVSVECAQDGGRCLPSSLNRCENPFFFDFFLRVLRPRHYRASVNGCVGGRALDPARMARARVDRCC